MANRDMMACGLDSSQAMNSDRFSGVCGGRAGEGGG